MCGKNLTTAALLLAAGTASASNVYKCPKPGGGVQFQGTPCAGQAADASKYAVRPYGSSPGDRYRRIQAEVAALNGQSSLATKKQILVKLQRDNDELREKMDVEVAKINLDISAIDKSSGTAAYNVQTNRMRAVVAKYATLIQSNDAQAAQIRYEIDAMEKRKP